MKKFYVFLTALISLSSFAQKETDKWYFGNGAALDFSSGTPSVIPSGAMMPSEGCAIMSDAVTGNLMFYTDGMNVWDNTHTQMPNGTGLLGGFSSTQPALIVPSPTATSQFYIFTTDDTGQSNGMQYSIVDMTQNGGKGDVITKNVPLVNFVTEKLTAVKDPDNTRFWIVAHEWGNDAFHAFELNTSGLQPAVVSHVGSIHSGAIQNTYGQMKFNPCGNKLALACGYMDVVELFDFNMNTGVVSNPISIPMTDHVYGIEFSPNSNLIYVSTYDAFQTLVQYDITAFNVSAIMASMQVISNVPSIYGMQLANNGMIYVCKSYNQYLGVIQNPNNNGVGCSYVDQGVNLDTLMMGTMSALSLPEFIQSYFLPAGFSCPAVPTGIAEMTKAQTVPVGPNPSAKEFTLQLKENASAEVYSCDGKLVETLTIEKNKAATFGSNYSEGVYLLKIKGTQTNSSVKLIKQ